MLETIKKSDDFYSYDLELKKRYLSAFQRNGFLNEYDFRAKLLDRDNPFMKKFLLNKWRLLE